MLGLNKLEKDKQKLIQEKCQTILSQMLRDEDNKYCVDCDAKGMLWDFEIFTILFVTTFLSTSRSEMGFVEPWNLSVYTLCRNTS